METNDKQKSVMAGQELNNADIEARYRISIKIKPAKSLLT